MTPERDENAEQLARWDIGIDVILNTGLLSQYGYTEALFRFVDGEITEAEFREVVS